LLEEICDFGTGGFRSPWWRAVIFDLRLREMPDALSVCLLALTFARREDFAGGRNSRMRRRLRWAAGVRRERVFAMKSRTRGAALVEFAITALVLYLLVAGGIELGRMVFVSQVLQDAARVAARELSVTPLPAGIAFEDALVYTDGVSVDVKAQIWDPDLLVVDLDVHEADLETYFASLPLINQALRPAFIAENVTIDGAPRRFLRYPGALLVKAGTPTGFTVGVPRVVSRDANGVETIEWIPVLAEVRGNPFNAACAPFGPFNMSPPPPPAPVQCGASTVPAGIAAVAINYPFQSAALSGFRNNGVDANGAPNPNLGKVIQAHDDTAILNSAPPPAGTSLLGAGQLPDPASDAGTAPYSGRLGLGTQQALGQVVRPYRSLLVGQAMFRREVTQ
jgi:hypothetical protein